MDKKTVILVVDDEVQNQILMEALLMAGGYEVVLAGDGMEALAKVKQTPPDVILLDVMMPVMDGFETARRLKADPETRIIPVVMVTALSEVEHRIRALEAGADDFLTKPVDKTELKVRVKTLVKVKAYNDYQRSYQKQLEQEVARRTRQLESLYDKLKHASLDTILRLSRAAEYKDQDTGAHIQRMSRYSAAIARHMGLRERTIEAILYAAPMHDVGKIGIPDRILLKPGKLDAEEWRIMQQHALIGGRILEGATEGFVRLARIIAENHHEKWDGSGYPHALAGRKIPLVARIIAIGDVYDALTSQRPYKKAFPVEKAQAIIREGRGTHFDPDVVDAFFAIGETIEEIRQTYKDEEESPMLILAGLVPSQTTSS